MLRALNDVCVLGALLATLVNVWRHLKNYRKPMDQRLIVRILCMVPMFAVTAWCALYKPRLAAFLTPIQDLYEGFVIYTFFTLCTNLLGGERDIIFTTTGRPPVKLLWPLNKIVKQVDISDPMTFLVIKRCIMQYVWVRCAITTLDLLFGDHVWLLCLVLYNVSLTITLNSLTLFWVCLLQDLKPYRALPKFMSIKLIVFFSYWQSLFVAVLGYWGVIPADKLVVVQSTLLCVETLVFAFVHWNAFPYTDYATTELIGFARLPVLYALRDAFGCRDLAYDFKCTFFGSAYGYREFDSVEAVLDHPESRTRTARLAAGMRYKNGGRSKYWLPRGARVGGAYPSYGAVDDTHEPHTPEDHSPEAHSPEASAASGPVESISWAKDDLAEDEILYTQARKIYGDYCYPTVTVRESLMYVPLAERMA